MKELLTSKADVSHRLDHYVAFVARMCTILKKLGVEDNEIDRGIFSALPLDLDCPLLRVYDE